MTEERTFPSVPASVPQARRYTLQALTGVGPELADAIAVMVSELTTNSVRHAATDFTVSIDQQPHEIQVAVTDGGEQQPTLRSPSPTEPSGRGLRIVSALADDWGVTEMVDRPGKTVWFSVAVPPANAREPDTLADRIAAVHPEGSAGTSPRSAPERKPTDRREQASTAS
jgi:two-component sensor histidine kinase